MPVLLASCAQGPFSAVVDKHVTDPWLRAMLDLECFVLSGMLAHDTLTAGGPLQVAAVCDTYHDSPQATRPRRLGSPGKQAWFGVWLLLGVCLRQLAAQWGVNLFVVLCCVMLCWPAEMAFMFMERSQGRNRIDYPVSPFWPPAALLRERMRTKGCPTQQKLLMQIWHTPATVCLHGVVVR